MKNKVLGTLMIAALVASGSSALVSCKDTESDDIQQTNNSIASLNASLQQQIKDLQDKIDAIKQCNCPDWSTPISNLQNDLAALKTRFASDSIAWGSKYTADSIKWANQYAQDKADWEQKFTESNNYWTQQIQNLQNQIDNLPKDDTSWRAILDELKNTTIPNLVAKDEELMGKYNALSDKESADSLLLTKKIAILDDFCNDLLTSLVTNTIVQATYSPAAGSFNFQEAGISSNTLLTYYGNNANGAFVFPTKDADYFYTDADEASLTAVDIEGDQATIGSGLLLDQDGAEGNAGTLYVTVNPSTVYKGLNFSLETTNGKTSPITLKDEGKVDYDLKTGYTRAAENSNVRAFKATISADNLDQVKLSIANKEQLKAALKRLVTERDQTKSSLKQLAKEAVKTIYDNLNSYSLYGLTTNFGLTNGTKTTTAKNFGQANILTGAFQPLSFGAFDNIANADHIPGIGYAERHLANFINSIKLQTVKVHGTDLSKVIRVNSLGKITKDGENYKLTANVTGKKSDGTTATADGYLKLTASQLTDLLSTVNSEAASNLEAAIEAYNNNYGDVNNMLANLNTALGYSTAVDDAKKEALKKIDSYLDNLNSRYAYWFNRVKKAALHPCMLFVGTNAQGVAGVHRLTAAGATVTGTSIKLIPTSYTYSLLAPAYKKFVKVYSGSDVRYAKVISGDDYEVNVEGLKSGEKYTVVYEAVDYTGKVMARKYTLNVK